MPTLLPRSAAAVAALILAVAAVCVSTTASAQTALKNGDVFENTKYTSAITYDANAKLKDETAYGSTVFWKGCTLSNKVTVKGTFDTKKDFPTSLYFMVQKATFSGAGQFDFFDLPPNSYVHAVETRATGVTDTLYNIRPTTETNNITALIDDSIVSYASGTVMFVNLEVPVGSPFIVTHMRNAQLTSTYAIFQTTTCSDGSTIFLEKVTCTKCRYDLVWLNKVTSISRQSALILKEISVIGHTRPDQDGLIVTGAEVEIDESSVLAMVDIDLTDNFKSRSPLSLFFNVNLSGDGAIVLLRIKMGPSGLVSSPQPADNKNFWVVAKKIDAREMTTDELKAVRLNVNTNNVIHWDGTGDDHQCVKAGLALPNTATYKLVGGRCEATCPQGNYLQPACTPRAVCTGVPNCKACYAHPKTKCLECLSHTTPINDDTVCKCPIRECVTCPTKDLCTDCSKDHKYSPQDNACFHCTIDKCTLCREDGKCSACENGYKLYNNQCIACTVDKCDACKAPEHCVECIDNHKPTANGKICFHCTIPGCKECSADGVCIDCINGYTFVSSTTPSNNKCVRCSIDVPNCKTCEEDSICKVCIDDYKLANDGADCFHCTVPNCNKCRADGVCDGCAGGYSLVESATTPTDNKCVRCSIDIDKCKTCEKDSVCKECIADHKPANEGTDCFHCTVPNCNRCRADGVCDDCAGGYSLVESATTPTDNKCVRCSIDIDKCKTCEKDSVCKECIADHKPANEGTDCFHCTVPNCNRCRADGVCDDCAGGYSLVESPTTPTDNKCVRCSIDIDNCKTCKEESVCSQCIADHKPTTDGKKCFHCTVPNCRECSSNGVCDDCAGGYSLVESATTPTDNKCVRCTMDIGKCKTCEVDSICKECIPDYTPANEGTDCFHCTIPSCLECSADGVCGQCEDGYSLVQSQSSPTDNKCVRCSIDNDKCKTCEVDSVCKECIADHKPANKGKDCFHCTISGCKECSADGVCTSCDDGSSLVVSEATPTENKCVGCSADVPKCRKCKEEGVCSECIADHKPANEGTVCFHCTVPNCLGCRADGVCSNCKDGYFLLENTDSPTDNKCVRCTIDIDKCKTCEEDSVCSECIDHHKPANEGTACFHCTVPNCNTCRADGVCGECEDGYSLVESDVTSTDNKCVRCSADVPKCRKCKEEGVCSECIADHKPANEGTACFHCTVSNCLGCRADGVCGNCKDGYFLLENTDSPTDNKCVRCTIDIDKCKTCEADSVCSECIDNHKPANEGTACFHCTIPNCAECSADGVCGQCNNGYSLVVSEDAPTKNHCVRCSMDIPNCDTCKVDGICSECIAGHKVSYNGLRCTPCDVAECQTCDSPNVCAVCSEGMTPSEDGQCTPCDIANCTQCSDTNTCALCTCGLVPALDGNTCVSCSTANCMYCDPSGGGTKCAECISGYELSSTGSCTKITLPDWALFMIVMAVSILVMTAIIVAYLLYLRHVAKVAQKFADAEERRKNRQAMGRGARNRTEIAVVDLGDIENAASGVRDHLKQCRV